MQRVMDRLLYEVFALLLARIEAIRIFLAFASYHVPSYLSMDVKRCLPLWQKLMRSICSQPPGFQDLISSEGLQSNESSLWVTSSSQSLDKYVAEILKKFDFVNVKTASTLIETQKPLVKDEEASDVDVHLYRQNILLLQADVGEVFVDSKLIVRLWFNFKEPKTTLIMKAQYSLVRIRSSMGFKESLRRVFDGTEALQLPTLFILWLATDSTDNANLVPMGKVSTAIETLKIKIPPVQSVNETVFLEHNMVAYLEKTDGNVEFHEIIDFLMRSSIHHPSQILVLDDPKLVPDKEKDIQMEQAKSTEDHTAEDGLLKLTQHLLSTIFRDEETIARVLPT
ncbi:hypothetical protein Tco_0446538 [Tanacetum coccineum]